MHLVRSGLVEAEHRGAVAAMDGMGRLVATAGDVERVFFLRSAAKPIQAAVTQSLGGAMVDSMLAVAAASHGGQPVHVGIVEWMLVEVGLDESFLRCPHAWPLSESARRRVVAAGHRRPRRVWHNCSGKHAAMLRTCVAQGWPVEGYLSPDHPLQQAMAAAHGEATGVNPGPPGVDGCGVPVFRASTVGMARAYAQLATQEELRPVWQAMHRFPALVSDVGEADTSVATWLDGAAKRGAQGCLGLGIRNRMGVAIKIWDGADRATGPGMIEALRQLGLLVGTTDRYLQAVARPDVTGGADPVGSLEPVFTMVRHDPNRAAPDHGDQGQRVQGQRVQGQSHQGQREE